MLLGAHESVAGGAWNAIARGRADGCEALQIFARPSRAVARPAAAARRGFQFRSEHATVGWPVMSHASYLINLCAADPVILEKSRDALVDELVRAEELGLDFVVAAPGRPPGRRARTTASGRRPHRCRGCTSARAACGSGCCWRSPPARGAASAAGSRTWPPSLERARGGDTLGVCFDTCHAHAAGHDLSTEDGYERVFDRVRRGRIGLERLRAFHLNDSKTPLGSRVDRHAEIGDGYLGLLPVLAAGQRPPLRGRPRRARDAVTAPTSCRRSPATSPACARSSARPARPARPNRRRCPTGPTLARVACSRSEAFPTFSAAMGPGLPSFPRLLATSSIFRATA